jgi:hypothetical protein
MDYGLSPIVPLLDVSATALAALEDVELQATTYFALRLLVRAGRFSVDDLPICFCCFR